MKKVAIIAGLAVVAAVVTLWVYGRPAYRRHKEARFSRRASDFLSRGDLRNASLSARQTLVVNPRNLEACRVMAELAEMSHSPHALDWRRRIAEVAPTITNKLRLASTALRAQGPSYPITAEMLEELKETAANVPAYHVVAAELALKLNHHGEAATQFEEAASLEPANELHQLNLAVLRLESTNANTAMQARSTLERLRTN